MNADCTSFPSLQDGVLVICSQTAREQTKQCSSISPTGEACPICYSEYDDGCPEHSRNALLPCAHVYCRSCVTHPQFPQLCPLCRQRWTRAMEACIEHGNHGPDSTVSNSTAVETSSSSLPAGLTRCTSKPIFVFAAIVAYSCGLGIPALLLAQAHWHSHCSDMFPMQHWLLVYGLSQLLFLFASGMTPLLHLCKCVKTFIVSHAAVVVVGFPFTISVDCFSKPAEQRMWWFGLALSVIHVITPLTAFVIAKRRQRDQGAR